jgi:hypothetical protein
MVSEIVVILLICVKVDAVICEKEVARKAFETEVRNKQAGPSILEQVVGNAFKV